MSANDALKNAFLQSTVTDETVIAVKAEDVQQSSGIDFSKHYFEPKIGSSYLIKFLPNPGGDPLTHRSLYKNLPDPERKGKTFHYVSSGNAKTCKALELFFELHALKKDGDAVAEKKIDKYLSRTNQACAKIQIIQSPEKEEIGMVRMFTFSTYGPNASVANLINKKLNPTKEQIQQGFEKEDIFDIFESSVMSIVCTEANYDGVKGRDFSASDWAPKKRGAMVIMDDEKIHNFSKKDIENGAIVESSLEAFNKFVEQVTHEDYDIYTYFSYKEVDDKRNTKEVNDYIKSVNAKVDEIIPVIREKTLAEIAQYGKKDTSENSSKKDEKTTDIYAESVPDELAGSVMNANKTEEQKPIDKKTTKKEEKSKNVESKTEESSEVDDILAE